MPHHLEHKNLPYSAKQLFDLVAGIEHYPEFLPWCKASRIIDRQEGAVTADLIIGYKMFQETFRSVVTLETSRAITVEYKSGPLSHLFNRWTFKDGVQRSCDLTFEVDFDFKSPLLGAIMSQFFDKALFKMVQAFEARAKELYT